MQSRIFRIGWKFIDLLFPPNCAGCEKWGNRYCTFCFDNTKTIKTTICSICGEPVTIDNGSVCKRCQSEEMFFDALRSWGYFEEPLKKAIHKLKYRRDISLGDVLSKPLIDLVFENSWQVELITAVPLDKFRIKERGYNQSEYLARPVAWNMKIPFNSAAIKRMKITRPQVGLSRAERQINISDAFVSDNRIVSGKNILVIDDVVTTGSTLNACAKSLKIAGSAKVYALTLARSTYL